MEPLANITITRPRAFVGWAKKLRVLCNGAEVARLANNSTVNIPLPVGTHSIQIKFDWLGGKPLEVTLLPGRTLHLMCGSVDDVLQSTLALFFLPNTYLRPHAISAAEYQSNLQRPRPAWGKGALYCALLAVLLAAVAFALVNLVTTVPDRAPAMFKVMGVIVGIVLAAGCGVILNRTYTKR